MIPTYVFTNDKHLFLLPGFAYLWNKYSGQPVTVVGYSKPELPDNFNFVSMGTQQPADKWSDTLIDFLRSIKDRYFILMLEDYWLNRLTNNLAIEMSTAWFDDDVLRIDLSGNRLDYAYRIIGKSGGYDIVQSTPQARYLMSFQAAIWHRENMLQILRRGENPWQAEIYGSERVNPLRVLGTKPAVMSYQPVWRGQRQKWQLDKIQPGDLAYIRKQGWLDAQ